MNWVPLFVLLGILGVWAFSYAIDWLNQASEKSKKSSTPSTHQRKSEVKSTLENSHVVRSALNDQFLRQKRELIPHLWSYKAPRLRVPNQQLIKWEVDFHSIICRAVSESSDIYLHELEALKQSKPTNITKELETRLIQLKSNKLRYPVTFIPVDVAQIPTPHYIKLVSDVDIANITERHQMNFRDGESFIAAIRDLNNEFSRGNDAARQKYEQGINEIDQINRSNSAAHDQAVLQWENERNLEISEIEECLSDLKNSTDLVLTASVIVNGSSLPLWVPRAVDVKYDRDQKILVVEKEYPNIQEKRFLKTVRLKQSESVKPVTEKERKDAVANVYSLLTLKIATDLAFLLPHHAVDFLVVNGWTQFRQKKDGQLKRAYCACVGAALSEFRSIELAHADPTSAISSLKGAVSKTFELVPVAPVIRIDSEDKRFIDKKDVIDKMSDGENLAAMDWEDFEHLCRELFEREFGSGGATVKVTRAARDQGVDAIITDPHPIRGGKIVVQAKRYVNTVDVSAVRDLAGTVSHEGAMKGLLVTTSQFGPDSYAFIQGKPLQLINGSELLYLLEKNGYKFRIDLDEARQMQRENGHRPFGRHR